MTTATLTRTPTSTTGPAGSTAPHATAQHKRIAFTPPWIHGDDEANVFDPAHAHPDFFHAYPESPIVGSAEDNRD